MVTLAVLGGCSNPPALPSNLLTSASPLASSYQPQPALKEGGTLTVGDWESPSNFAPLFNAEVPAAQINSLIFAGLTRQAADLTWVPDLAVRVPTLANGDVHWDRARSVMDVTYRLRPGLEWSDGTPITSQDVAYTWRVIVDPKDAAVLSTDGYSDISRIDVLDSRSFTLHFDHVFPQYLSLFPAILPEHRLRDIPVDQLAGDAYWSRPDVVSGPFQISELVPDDHIVLARNAAWSRGRAGSSPHLSSIVYRIYPELGQLVDAARAGQVGLALEIPDDALAALKDTGQAIADYRSGLAYEQVTFNQEDPNPVTGKPPIWKNDPLLLQALRLAIDRHQMVQDLLGGKVKVADSPIPSALGAYHQDDVPAAADLKRANQLLDADGWRKGPDGIRRYGGRPLAFSITTALGDPLRLAVQDRLVQAWLSLGAQVTVTNAHPGDLFSGYAQGGMLEHGQFEAGLWTWSIGSDPDGVYPIEDSTQIPSDANQGRGANFGRVQNRVIDRNLDWGRSSLEPQDRISAYDAVEATYARLGAELPLYERGVAVLATPHLHNLEVNPAPDTTLWNAADWWLG